MFSSKIFHVVCAQRKEVDLIIDWTAAEGWNPGLHDAECFYKTDPKGFFVGKLDNEIISCISAISYNQNFGFLGLYIVKPEYRNQGYGIKIWNKAFEYLKTQNIGLDGVVDQQANYQKSGFKLAYRNIRFQFLSNKKIKINNTNIIQLNKIPFEVVLKYDNNLFPASRPIFLECWINQHESTAVGVLEKGELKGYGVIRKCRKGYKIGPLFADNIDIAEQLFISMNNSVKPCSIIFFDIPEVNQQAFKLVQKYNMIKVFETARMYNKMEPQIDMCKIFGITTFELG